MKISISKSIIIDLILYNQLIFFVLLVFDNINFLWISLNIIFSILILIYNPRISEKFSLLILTSVFILLSYLFISSSKITSILFSVALILTSIVQLNFISNNLKIYNFTKFVKNTIYFFLIFYIAQLILYKTGILRLNTFGLSEDMNSIFRFNSLMAEPSYSSTVMITLLFINQKLNINKFLIEIIGFIFIVLCQSLFGIILYLIYCSIYHRKKFKKLFYFELFSILIIIGFFFTSEYFERIKSLIYFISQNNFDVFELVKVEPSGAFRILPFILYIENFELSSLSNYLFGYGSGSSESFLNYELFKIGYGTSEFEGSFQGGFLPSFLIDYGFIITLIFLYTIKTTFLLKNDIFQYLILLAILLNVNINTQLFWFPLFLFFTTKIYEKNIS